MRIGLHTIGANPSLSARVMRRVYAVWFWRNVAPLLAVEVILLAGVAVGVLTHISLRHIFLNALSASGDARSFFQFFVDNFFVKSIQTRLLVAVYLVLAAFFVRDLRAALHRLEAIGGGKIGLAALPFRR